MQSLRDVLLLDSNSPDLLKQPALTQNQEHLYIQFHSNGGGVPTTPIAHYKRSEEHTMWHLVKNNKIKHIALISFF